MLVLLTETYCNKVNIEIRQRDDVIQTWWWVGRVAQWVYLLSYGLDGPVIKSWWGGEIFRACPERPWGPPSLLYNWYRVLPGGKDRPGLDADPSPLLVPWSRKSRAMSLLLYGPYGLYKASVPVQVYILLLISLMMAMKNEPKQCSEHKQYTVFLFVVLVWIYKFLKCDFCKRQNKRRVQKEIELFKQRANQQREHAAATERT